MAFHPSCQTPPTSRYISPTGFIRPKPCSCGVLISWSTGNEVKMRGGWVPSGCQNVTTIQEPWDSTDRLLRFQPNTYGDRRPSPLSKCRGAIISTFTSGSPSSYGTELPGTTTRQDPAGRQGMRLLPLAFPIQIGLLPNRAIRAGPLMSRSKPRVHLPRGTMNRVTQSRCLDGYFYGYYYYTPLTRKASLYK